MRTSYQGANRDSTAGFDHSLESGPLLRRHQAHDPGDPIVAPSTTSRFALRDALGRGGMGVVYRAYDAELGLDVALKALNDLGSEGRSWLKAEFRSLAGIVHPNLVQLHELVVDDQRCFFTMELVRGLDLVEFFLTHSEQGGSRTTLAEWLKLARESARQLAHALASLHRAGKLHRDVKPSNVLVTDSGRVVLLDFGLVEPIPTAFDTTQGRRLIAGTLAYMSPEQAIGQRLTAASDWYSFGVTLFEALTGRLPIDGEPHVIYALKRVEPGARPSRFLGGIPEDLDLLVSRLLDPDPLQRPGEEEILATLGGTSVQGIVSLPPSRLERAKAPFLGRERELGLLAEAWDDALNGDSVVFTVSGPSGIGKSELIRRFVESPSVAQSGMVLSGRCHPQESLPFNALDGVVDDLATNLSRLSVQELQAIRPAGLDALVRLFPALARVPGFLPLEPAPFRDRATPELRKAAFVALKELLVRLARFKVPLLWLDDLQWADVDSAVLLRELLAGQERPPLLALLSLRVEDLHESEVMKALGAREGHGANAAIREVKLEPLSKDEGLSLIRELLPSDSLQAEERLSELYHEAGGVPFFLCELGRYFKSADWAKDAASLRVEAMLAHRTAQLPPDARRLLELVSVAGEPLEPSVVLRAAGLQPANLPLFRTLEQLSFVRTAAGPERLAEVYHHRVRDHLLEGMSEGLRREHHLALAGGLLQASNPNLQSVVEHAERGGDIAAAIRYVVPAARQAADAFAFARAANLYRRALELGVKDLDEVELRTQLGSALANAGLGREAGEAYERAALVLVEQGRDDSQRLLSLRRRASEQFLQSGHDALAVHALKALLSGHQLRFPKDRAQALRWAMGLKVKTFVRSLDLAMRSESEVPTQQLERFDALWSVTMRICMVNHVQTGYLAVRCLESALEIREPSRFVLALSLEAVALCMVPMEMFQRRAEAMLQRAQKLVEGHGGDYHRALLLSGMGAREWLRGAFAPSVHYMDEATELVSRSVQGVSWEHALFDNWAFSALALLGRFRELSRRCHLALAQGEQRDDRYQARNASLGESVFAWLAQDQPAKARELAERAIAWSPKEFTTQHYYHYVSIAHVRLYEGDFAGAHEFSETVWPLLTTNMYLWNAMVRDELTQLRGRTALGLAACSAGNAQRALLKLARDCARTLTKNGLTCGVAWAQLIEAGAFRIEGRENDARACFARAAHGFAAVGMMAFEAASRYCLGCLTPAQAGRSLREEARAWFASEDVKNVERLIVALAPGCHAEPLA